MSYIVSNEKNWNIQQLKATSINIEKNKKEEKYHLPVIYD